MSYKKFTILYITIILISMACLSPMYLFLKRSFEHQTYEEIVKEQIKTKAVYGTALNQNTFLYKFELVKYLKPEVLALGSSRVMKFREEFFNTSFVNTGGATNDLTEGKKLITKILRTHKPKVILFGVDFRWFNRNIRYDYTHPYHTNTGDILTFSKLIVKPLQFLMDGKLNFEKFLNILSTVNHPHKYSRYNGMGLDSIINHNGYAPDGSRFDGKYLFNFSKSHDLKLGQTLSELNGGINTFTFGEEVDLVNIDKLKEIIKIVKDSGSKLFLFLTPVSPTISYEFEKKKYKFKYISKLREKIKELGGIDYHDIRSIVEDDCEFLDGYHGGDVLYQRILLDLGKSFPSLKTYLNEELLIKLTKKFKGSTISNINGEIKSKSINEDVMELGCPSVHN